MSTDASPALTALLEGYYRRSRRRFLALGVISGVVLALALAWGVASVTYFAAGHCPTTMRRRATCLDRLHREVATRTAVLGAAPATLLILAALGGLPLRVLSRAPLLRLIADPARIAWIYPKRTSVRRRGVEVSHALEVVVCTVDGARASLAMRDDEVHGAVRLLSMRAPEAARGYSPALEARFRASPASLKRAAASAS